MGTFIELTAADGHRFAAWESRPAGKPRGGLVIAPEIFGINGHIRSVADGYAADGYLVVAPALFDRLQRNYETGYAPADIQAGVALMQKIRMEDALKDVAAAVAHAASAGRVAIVGYCWGGTVAWVAAARTAGLACAVPYYGGSMPSYATEVPACPVLCHFGEEDKSPTPQQARALLAAHPEVAAHFYQGAGHGFNCDQRASYNPQAAQLARTRTLAFLTQHVG